LVAGLVLGLFAAPAITRADPADAAPTQPPSGTRKGRCRIRIAGISKEQHGRLSNLIMREMDDAERDVLGLMVGNLFSFEATEIVLGGGMTADIRIEIDPKKHPGAKRAAREILEAIIGRLKARVAEIEHERSQVYKQKADRLLASLNETSGRLADIRKKMRHDRRSAGGPLEPAVLDALVREVESTSQRIEIDRAGMAARIEAIQKKIAELGKAAQAKVADDVIVTELEGVVHLRKQQLAITRTRQKGSERDELRDAQQFREAEIKFAEARIRLAERKEFLSQATGGDVLVRLNAELTTLTIDQAEKAARRDRLMNQRARMQELRDAADRYAQSVAELEQLRKEENDIRGKMSALETEFHSVQPLSVKLVGEIKAK